MEDAWILLIAPLIIIVIVLLIRRSDAKKIGKNKIKIDRKGIKEEFSGLIGGIILVVVVIVIFKAVSGGFNKFGDYKDDKNSAKSSCSRQASKANTEFAAKNLYKSCMKRMGY